MVTISSRSFDLLPQPSMVKQERSLRITWNGGELTGKCPPRVQSAYARLPFCVPLLVECNDESSGYPALNDHAAYTLSITETGVELKAESQWGCLAGLSTLEQLEDNGTFPVAIVEDKPRFPWRGLMLDVARHFIEIGTLKRTIDVMAYFKLNVLHLHLTDDQGFRFWSSRYPELASSKHYKPDELRDLVNFAADRGIRVVPEIDCPGHVTSWLVAHPEWGTELVEGPSNKFGAHDACLDPTGRLDRPLELLFEDLADVFPDDYVHFGGDEVQFSWWKKSSSIQTFMKDQNISNLVDVQAVFNKHVTKILRNLGKRPIGWDEVLHRNLPLDVVVQCWRGVHVRDVAIEAGYDSLLSAPYYLDLFFPADAHYGFDPGASGSALQKANGSLKRDARFSHVGDSLDWLEKSSSLPSLPNRKAGRNLGGEACLFSELVSDDIVDVRLWSRLPAIAELFWTTCQHSGIDNLYDRMEYHQKKIVRFGVEIPDPRLGVYEEVGYLIEMLEPVKWYLRLLGPSVMKARINGIGESDLKRPYNLSTSLTRVIDRIAPESIATRRFSADVRRGSDITGWLKNWQLQRKAFSSIASKFPEIRELEAASIALNQLAKNWLEEKSPRLDLLGPYGEYVLPVALVRPHAT